MERTEDLLSLGSDHKTQIANINLTKQFTSYRPIRETRPVFEVAASGIFEQSSHKQKPKSKSALGKRPSPRKEKVGIESAVKAPQILHKSTQRWNFNTNVQPKPYQPLTRSFDSRGSRSIPAPQESLKKRALKESKSASALNGRKQAWVHAPFSLENFRKEKAKGGLRHSESQLQFEIGSDDEEEMTSA